MVYLILFFFSCAGLAAQENLKNGGFEAWKDSADDKLPVNWSADMIAALWLGPSDSAKEGEKALVLSTWYTYVEGSLFYGEHARPRRDSWTNYTVSFQSRPEKLAGWYRYTHPVNDTDAAGAKIIIKDHSGDTLAYGDALLDTSVHWQPFEIPIRYFSNKPASAIAIIFTSREKGGGLNEDNNPNRLYLDHLRLVYPKREPE